MNDFDMRLVQIQKLILEMQNRHESLWVLKKDFTGKLTEVRKIILHCEKYLDYMEKYGMGGICPISKKRIVDE